MKINTKHTKSKVSDTWQTTNTISRAAGVNWTTAYRHLTELELAGEVERLGVDSGGVILWRLATRGVSNG